MPAIVVGGERTVEDDPGELPPESLERARKALAERKKNKDMEQTPSNPPLSPDGYRDPVWSKKESRWICCARNENKWRIWYKEQWYTIPEYEKFFELKAPHQYHKVDTTTTSFWKRWTTFFTGGGQK